MAMKLKGSFTVEATILVPICIFTIVGMFYVAFSIHDMVVIRSNTIIAGIREVNVKENYMSIDTKEVDYDSVYKKTVYVGNKEFFDSQRGSIENRLKNTIISGTLLNQNIEVDNSKNLVSTTYKVNEVEETQHYSGNKSFDRLVKNIIASRWYNNGS